jgi:hypothetical protein
MNLLRKTGWPPVSLGEHAAGKTEISAQESTMVARFYGQAVLQCRVLV